MSSETEKKYRLKKERTDSYESRWNKKFQQAQTLGTPTETTARTLALECISALASSSSLTQSERPFSADHISAVHPSCGRGSPRRRNEKTDQSSSHISNFRNLSAILSLSKATISPQTIESKTQRNKHKNIVINMNIRTNHRQIQHQGHTYHARLWTGNNKTLAT